MNTFHIVLRNRLPGGIILSNLIQSASDFRYGPKVTFCRFFYHLAVYCFGCRLIHMNRAIAELIAPFPTLYHFTPEANVESIKEKGLLPNHGKVWMTDWTDARWVSRFRKRPIACFRINTEHLISSGHKVYAMEHCHEFTTDHVPPDCLSVNQ